ncbi:hypothetical protein BJP36_31440 [Moorena producens JHB]|uniref:Uncharacterized protein n=1 Tax=Moorena producens (strain JHB) TaxID=1454205 RepID=A0A1D9G823_MOOP1|nr:hypothetical protein [Moorena producens]AOY83768.1 hypothetical protein BJP36_31440 [Moorena producens JHB]
MKPYPGFEEYKDDKKIVLSENRSKLTFFNPKQDQIRIIKVDGCAIRENKTLRCDYLLVPTNKVEIYVELKGSKIIHAVEQIESTIRLLSDNPQKIKKLCFVVSTRVPKLTTTIQQLKIKFRKHYNASFEVKTTPYTYDLSKITI